MSCPARRSSSGCRSTWSVRSATSAACCPHRSLASVRSNCAAWCSRSRVLRSAVNQGVSWPWHASPRHRPSACSNSATARSSSDDVPCSLTELAEPVQVNGFRVDGQPVAGGLPGDRRVRGGQGAAQQCQLALQRVGGPLRPPVCVPDPLQQLVSGDRPVRLRQQDGQDALLAGAPDRDALPADREFDFAQHTELNRHRQPAVTPTPTTYNAMSLYVSRTDRRAGSIRAAVGWR